MGDPWPALPKDGGPKHDPRLPLPRLVDVVAALKHVVGTAVRDAARLVQPAADVIANGVANPPVALAALTTPRTPADAPREISVPYALNARFEELRSDHLAQAQATDQFGKERCITLVRDKATGELVPMHELVGTGKHCEPNLNIDTSRFDLVGSFHSHVNLKQVVPPIDPADPALSFSGGDVVFQSQQKLPVSILQASADKQFMLVRTEASAVLSVEQGAAIKAEYQRQLDHVSGGGRNLQGFEYATRRLAKDMARDHGFALYEGKNGTFTRVEPEVKD